MNPYIESKWTNRTKEWERKQKWIRWESIVISLQSNCYICSCIKTKSMQFVPKIYISLKNKHITCAQKSTNQNHSVRRTVVWNVKPRHTSRLNQIIIHLDAVQHYFSFLPLILFSDLHLKAHQFTHTFHWNMHWTRTNNMIHGGSYWISKHRNALSRFKFQFFFFAKWMC